MIDNDLFKEFLLWELVRKEIKSKMIKLINLFLNQLDRGDKDENLSSFLTYILESLNI